MTVSGYPQNAKLSWLSKHHAADIEKMSIWLIVFLSIVWMPGVRRTLSTAPESRITHLDSFVAVFRDYKNGD